MAVVLLLAGGALTWVRITPPSWLHHSSPRTASARPSAPKVSPVSPLQQPTVTGPPTDPFSGSPADAWADGAAGIAVPAARPRGPYTAAQVKSAYATARELLIAGNLNWPTLRGGAPKAYEALLIAKERAQFQAGLRTTALNKDGSVANSRREVSSFAPGSTSFVTTVVKVHGTMTAGLATISGTGILRITYDYLFVYAVEPPGRPADWMRVVQQQYGTVDFARWDDLGSSFEPWVNGGYATSGINCGTRDGYIHPAYPLGPSSGPSPSGAPLNPYSLGTPAAGSTAGCHPSTGT